jgi:hypothetical protein
MTTTKSGQRSNLSTEDKAAVEKYLKQGKRNTEILTLLKGRVDITRIYTIKAELKKRGELPEQTNPTTV